MNTPTSITITTPARQAAINGLAIVGFIVLVVAGVWLAVYSTRFVPIVVDGVGSAAVYLGSVFNPSQNSALSVVPTASTTISFGNASSTASTSTTTTTVVIKTTPPSVKPSYPVVTTVTTAVPTAPAPYGLADLMIRIVARGYLTNSSDFNSFTPSDTVPSGYLPAVLVAVKNIGTNYSGTWNLQASVPADRTPAISQASSIAPGQEVMFVAHIDSVRRGTETITVTADPDGRVAESNTNNNQDSKTLEIL